MVALFVVLTIITFLTIDYLVQRAQLRQARASAAGTAAFSPLPRPAAAHEELSMLSAIPIERIPKNAFIDIGHTWVEVEPSGLARVGADWLPGTILGPPEKIDLARPGTEVKRGDPILRLRRHGRSVTLRAPMDGLVEEVNPVLADDPTPVASDPFGAGWLYRIAPRNLGAALRAMLIDDEAMNWMRREVERLRDALRGLSRRAALGGQSALAAQLALAAEPVRTAVGPTMQDGGLPVASLADQIDAESWNDLARKFFES